MKKKVIGIICGGKSGEHEISLQSAYYVFKNINRKKYRAVLLGIDKEGYWHFAEKYEDLIEERKPLPRMKQNTDAVILIKDHTKTVIFSLKKKKEIARIDVAFPLIHGTYGEDGCLQGYLELLEIPYVGAGVLASVIGMDKEVSKRLLQKEKIPIAQFIVLYQSNSQKQNLILLKQAVKTLKFPIFVKPSCSGSSLGISKVNNWPELKKAIALAFRYDNKIILEEYTKGREIECSVLGNDKPKVSLPGEIKPHDIFYSYKAKYLDPQGAELLTPAPLTKNIVSKIQTLALKVYKILGIQGMARVDGFLTKNNEFVISEINTIPGFTQISMYPKLWQVSGLSYSRLLDKLIQLALESYSQKKKLKRSYN